ncbi:zinc finger protein 780A-like [Anopheles marshallii]|uniref:zinc finger protein 780A-like n=1 Tax=Anopheles marshallii TaxID=1521116 RepID=UPI00237AE3E4|nr:zinc finger protein 780A-like [Anopheles marshallii]
MRPEVMCRICASPDTALDLVDIFEEHVSQECVADILLELAGIKATVDDGFSRNCCAQCHADLTSAVTVRRKCIESDKLFHTSLECNSPLMDGLSDNESIISSEPEQTPCYHCYECLIDFYSSESLKEHYQSKHANAIHGWESFGISEISLFDTTDEEEDERVPTDLVSKLENSSPSMIYCCGCLLTFATDIELRLHSDTVHASNAMQIDEIRTFQCNICYRLFTNACALENHQSIEYFTRFQCATCGILFGQLAQLTRHEFTHMRGKFTCDICDKIFSNPGSMNSHMKRFHSNVKAIKTQEKHICNQCGKSVSSAAYLKTHMRLHSNEEPFACTICGARFKLYRYLKWHMAVHKGLHKCKECDASFKSPSELQDHMHSHVGSREFICTFCGSNFCTKQNLCKHMRKVHGHYKRKIINHLAMNQNILCRVCASTDATLDVVDIFDDYVAEERIADILLELAGIKISNHLAMNQNILCRVCVSTDTALDLMDIFDDYETEERIADILLELAGIKATVDDGFPRNCCAQCYSDLTSAVTVRRKCIESEKLFHTSQDWSTPLMDDFSDNLSIESPKPNQIPMYYCSECSIDFYSSESLKEHYQSKHANAIHGWKSFGICDISLFDTTDDEVDARVTPKETPVKTSQRCCGCLLLFDSVTELQQHSQAVHAPNAIAANEDKPFPCEICYKTYTTKQGVIAHQMKRRNLAYQCSFCGILYGSKFELGHHENKHTNRTFDCNVCGRKFFKLNALNRHKEAIHFEQELKHTCSICGASVKTIEYLRVHMKLHSDEEPFSCNLCGARFKLYRYLSWHMKIHSGLHKCEECAISFKSPSELRDHMQRHIGSKDVHCTMCRSRFYTKKHLQKHMRTKHAQYQRSKIVIKKKPQRN